MYRHLRTKLHTTSRIFSPYPVTEDNGRTRNIRFDTSLPGRPSRCSGTSQKPASSAGRLETMRPLYGRWLASSTGSRRTWSRDRSTLRMRLPTRFLIRPAMSTLPIRRTTTRFPTPTSPTSSSSGSDAHSPTSRCCAIRSIVEFVGKGEFRIGSGRGTDGRFERVSFQEPVSAEDVMFEADVYLLTRGLAKRLRSRLLRNQRRRRDRKLVRRDPAAARRVQDRNRTLRRVRNLRHRPSRRHGRRSASTVTSRPTEHDSCRSSARAAT